ncbi:MAG: helix-turn-helix transcriptional regulator [Rubrivivax sp.]|nr:helix-turn-helix transcriptional regulator [Rubrivivax sp.]
MAPKARSAMAASAGSAWRGHVFLGLGFAIYDGPVAATHAHAHHAAQVVLCEGAELILESGARRAAARGFVVPPDRTHAIAQGCAWATIIYVEPESDLGHRLATGGSDSVAGDDPASWARAAEGLDDLRCGPIRTWDAARTLVDQLRSHLLGPVPVQRSVPPPISALLQLLPGALDAPIRLQALAARVGLSESRLGHLVSEHLGLSFRRLVLWLRLRAATDALARACTVTDAAHAAGFADAAHLTRAFRRMLGVAPGAISRSVTWHAAQPHRDPLP